MKNRKDLNKEERRAYYVLWGSATVVGLLLMLLSNHVSLPENTFLGVIVILTIVCIPPTISFMDNKLFFNGVEECKGNQNG